MHLPNAPLAALIVLAAGCAAAAAQTPPAAAESFYFGAEWRFVRAGDVQLAWAPGARQMDMKLRTVGLVAALFKVDDTYRSTYDAGLCATSLSLEAREGRRSRDTKVTFDRAQLRSHYLEKDSLSGATVAAKEMDIPSCVHDVPGGLDRLRQLLPQPGTSIELPVSDGKKLVMARVEAQARERLRTPVGEYSTIRYEAFLFNGVIYARKGRLFIWVSEDERRAAAADSRAIALLCRHHHAAAGESAINHVEERSSRAGSGRAVCPGADGVAAGAAD